MLICYIRRIQNHTVFLLLSFLIKQKKYGVFFVKHGRILSCTGLHHIWIHLIKKFLRTTTTFPPRLSTLRREVDYHHPSNCQIWEQWKNNLKTWEANLPKKTTKHHDSSTIKNTGSNTQYQENEQL